MLKKGYRIGYLMSDAAYMRNRFQKLLDDNAVALLSLLEADSKFKEMKGELLEIAITSDDIEIADTIRALTALNNDILKMMTSVGTVTKNISEYRDHL